MVVFSIVESAAFRVFVVVFSIVESAAFIMFVSGLNCGEPFTVVFLLNFNVRTFSKGQFIQWPMAKKPVVAALLQIWFIESG